MHLGVRYLCRIDEGLNDKFYCEILKDEFLNILEYYDLDP